MVMCPQRPSPEESAGGSSGGHSGVPAPRSGGARHHKYTPEAVAAGLSGLNWVGEGSSRMPRKRGRYRAKHHGRNASNARTISEKAFDDREESGRECSSGATSTQMDATVVQPGAGLGPLFGCADRYCLLLRVSVKAPTTARPAARSQRLEGSGTGIAATAIAARIDIQYPHLLGL
jgi:hypothetical protein